MIVFTDLDGTLLDHETYSCAAASEALSLLRQQGIPLILASSKTAAEIAPLRHDLGFGQCEAIVENGAGMLEPGAFEERAADDYERILSWLADLPDAFRSHFQGFSDWSVEEIAKRTGLSVSAAELAKQRNFSEPGLWSGDAQQFSAFCRLLKDHGLVAQQGGRFLSLSFGGNKAEQMAEIRKRHEISHNPVFSIALGDAENDVAMLEAADLGVIIPNPTHKGIPRLAGEANG
ncbi:MAG: HAD-IIB family hydrolase, partial [Hyphomicrobiales bacterium]